MSSSATENTHREMFYKPKHDWTVGTRLKEAPISACVQLGMLMPAGIPLPAKVRTSREVKSGLRKVSFSNSRGQGSSGSKTSAELTSLAKRSLIALFTTATKPKGDEKNPMSGGELKTKHKEWHQLFYKINCLFFSFTLHVSLKQLQYKREVICCYDCYYGSHWKLTQLCCITIFWLRNQCRGGQHCVCDVQCVYKKGPSLWLIIG